MAQPLIEILLVEDSPDDAELALLALRENHLANRIRLAHDGAEALEYLFGSPESGPPAVEQPRLILLDLKLPKVDGLEVLKRIKGDPRTQYIPVVVMTSSSEERDVVASYQLGVNSYIVKPVDFEQFTAAVRQLGLYWLLLNHLPA
jgi:two-component system response regulator